LTEIRARTHAADRHVGVGCLVLNFVPGPHDEAYSPDQDSVNDVLMSTHAVRPSLLRELHDGTLPAWLFMRLVRTELVHAAHVGFHSAADGSGPAGSLLAERVGQIEFALDGVPQASETLCLGENVPLDRPTDRVYFDVGGHGLRVGLDYRDDLMDWAEMVTHALRLINGVQ
jgi:hypothetical protein